MAQLSRINDETDLLYGTISLQRRIKKRDKNWAVWRPQKEKARPSMSHSKRHFTLLVDKSGSMTTRDCPNDRTRWEEAKDATKSFIQACLTLDSNSSVDVFFFGPLSHFWVVAAVGADVCRSCDCFANGASSPSPPNSGSRGKEEHMVVKSARDVEARFSKDPTEGTYLAGCLQKAIDLVPSDEMVLTFLPWEEKREQREGGKGKSEDTNLVNDEQHTILVITDGETSDKLHLEKVIMEASNKIPRDECLAISFIQVGRVRVSPCTVKAAHPSDHVAGQGRQAVPQDVGWWPQGL